MEVPDTIKKFAPEIGMVLGSGLGGLANSLERVEFELPYAEVPGLPVSKVPGHAGKFVLGELFGRKVLMACGRVHLYEGWSARDVTASTRFLAASGLRTLLLTNAAGSLHQKFLPGQWMMISDHLNLLGTSPLEGGPRFQDLSQAYSPELRRSFQQASELLGLTLHEGVYAAMRGPQYETPAEIRMLQVLGADAVGMSTVPEVIQARALGLQVAAFSCLTNWGAGINLQEVDHQDVMDVGTRSSGVMIQLLEAVFRAGKPEIRT